MKLVKEHYEGNWVSWNVDVGLNLGGGKVFFLSSAVLLQ